MKKWVIWVGFLVAVLGVGIDNAQALDCRVVSASVMYFDPERFLTVAKVAAVSEQQATTMMIDDMQRGTAVLVNVGTKLDRVAPVNELVVSVILNGIPMVALSTTKKCR